MSERVRDGEKMELVALEVPVSDKKVAKQNTEYGEMSQKVRELFAAIAEGEEYDPNLEDSYENPREEYEELIEAGDLPDDWQKRRKRVLLRDEFICQNCHEEGGSDGPKQLVVHHIVPWKKGGTHYVSNLTTLCVDCHESIHRGYC